MYNTYIIAYVAYQESKSILLSPAARRPPLQSRISTTHTPTHTDTPKIKKEKEENPPPLPFAVCHVCIIALWGRKKGRKKEKKT